MWADGALPKGQVHVVGDQFDYEYIPKTGMVSFKRQLQTIARTPMLVLRCNSPPPPSPLPSSSLTEIPYSEKMCTTSEERKLIYGSHPMINALCPKEKEWMQPVLHDLDSLVMKFPLAWAMGKFVPLPVPDEWKTLANDDEGDAMTTEMHDIYKGVAWLTIGNIILDEEKERCYLIKDILHCNWSPTFLPRKGETLMDWHIRLVEKVLEWKGNMDENYADYINIRPITKLVMDPIEVDWRGFTVLDARGNITVKEKKCRSEFSSFPFTRRNVKFFCWCSFTQRNTTTCMVTLLYIKELHDLSSFL